MFSSVFNPLATANVRAINTRSFNVRTIKFVRTASKSRWFSAAKSFVDYSTKQPTRHLGMHLT
ncbi:MAG: hypothetical protein O3B17_02655 [Actinomycetota bacterium]|nr:hypothetical protein [Actinomycetota bacterium]